jgi:hypothetical protein
MYGRAAVPPTILDIDQVERLLAEHLHRVVDVRFVVVDLGPCSA